MVATRTIPNGSPILVVDDETQLVDLLSTVLQRNGYEVIAAQDGNLAIQAVEERNPQLVILDINIPVINGFEVCRKVREEGETPVIVISGRASEKDKLHAFGLGADDYLTKPFNPVTLKSRISDCLTRHDRAQP